MKPAYASLGIMQFVNVWNEFMQALLIFFLFASKLFMDGLTAGAVKE